MTNGPSQQGTPPLAPPERTALLIAEYEFARDNRGNADATAWEMTAIVWGGQTLLLGFVLEAISNRDVQLLIVLVGVLGLVLCRFNYVVVTTRNLVCNAMNRICGEIENSTEEMLRKPQNRLNSVYPSRVQTLWFNVVNWVFAVAWLAVIAKTLWLFCYHQSSPMSWL
jgi:hypothetical protein